MKFITALILTMLLSFAACLFLPWWSIAISAFIVAVLIPQKPRRAFITGFMGLLLLWGGICSWIDFGNEHLLSKKMALLLPLSGSYVLLIIITALIGALVGGFGALSGSYLRKTI